MTSPLHRIEHVTARLRRARDERIRERFAAAVQIPGAAAYRQLLPHSLAFSSLRPSSAPVPAVNLVLPELSGGAIFAGIRTALDAATGLASRWGLGLRILVLRGAPTGSARTDLEEWIRRELPAARPVALEILPVEWAIRRSVHQDDLWVATHWSTAHPLDVACRLEVLRSERVMYLVQDYEPGFVAWSSEFALAQATYHAGFDLVVNSVPVQRQLADAEGITVPESQVFRPHLDLTRLARAREERAARSIGPGARVLFYARPNKPRNLFQVGMAALELAAEEADREGAPLTVASAGDDHAVPGNARLSSMSVLGKLPWDGYFAELSLSDVVLSLQMSPHPSHPPLDAVMSGAHAVTNELGSSRSGLHPRLHAVAPEPTVLAEAVLSATRAAVESGGEQVDPAALLPALGAELDEVLDAAAVRLETAS